MVRCKLKLRSGEAASGWKSRHKGGFTFFARRMEIDGFKEVVHCRERPERAVYLARDRMFAMGCVGRG